MEAPTEQGETLKDGALVDETAARVILAPLAAGRGGCCDGPLVSTKECSFGGVVGAEENRGFSSYLRWS